jgi:hypothetical protein
MLWLVIGMVIAVLVLLAGVMGGAMLDTWDAIRAGNVSRGVLALLVLPVALVIAAGAGMVHALRHNRGKLAFAAGSAGIMIDPHGSPQGVRWERIESLTARHEIGMTMLVTCTDGAGAFPIARIRGDGPEWAAFRTLAAGKQIPVRIV